MSTILNKLGASGETGATARVKINLAIDEVNVHAASIEVLMAPMNAYNTQALMLAAGLDRGSRAIVTADTDPLKNGEYLVINAGGSSMADFSKEPGSVGGGTTIPIKEVDTWVAGNSYKANTLVIESSILYIVAADYVAGATIADDITANNVVAVSGQAAVDDDEIITVVDSSTAFGAVVEAGKLVVDLGTNILYMVVSQIAGSESIDTAAIKLKEIGSGASSVASVYQFEYKWKDAATNTPNNAHISVDTDDETQATKLYIHKLDKNNVDMSAFLNEIGVGDWLNIHEKDDSTSSYAYDVTSVATLVGDVFEYDVTYYASSPAGTMGNNDVIGVYWKSAGINSGNLKSDGTVLMDVGYIPNNDNAIATIGMALKDSQFITGQHVNQIKILESSQTIDEIILFSAAVIIGDTYKFHPLEAIVPPSILHIELKPGGSAGMGALTGIIDLQTADTITYGGGRFGPGASDFYFKAIYNSGTDDLLIELQKSTYKTGATANLQIKIKEDGISENLLSESFLLELLSKEYRIKGIYQDIPSLMAATGKEKDIAVVIQGDKLFEWDNTLQTPTWKLIGDPGVNESSAYTTQALMLASGSSFSSGDLSMVSNDPDKAKNGWYLASKNAPTVISDYSKFEINAHDVTTSIGGNDIILHDVLVDLQDNAMLNRGSIDDMGEITKIGIYYGPTTAGNPGIVNGAKTGPAMVMASADAAGNFGFLWMGDDQVLRSGGQPSGGAIAWKATGAGAFIPLADADLDMDQNAILNVMDPRNGVPGKFDAVNKHSMDEALAARSLYQGAYSPVTNSPDLVVMSDSDYTAPVPDDNISKPNNSAPDPASGNIIVWYRPADNIFGPTLPINISHDVLTTIRLSSGQKVTSTLHTGDYLTKADIQTEITDNLVDISKGVLAVHFYKTGASNLPWIGVETINSFCTGIEFENENDASAGGLSSGAPGSGNTVLNSYNWVIATKDADTPENATPGIPGIRVGEKLYNGDVLQWSDTVQGFELFRSGVMTKSFANDHYWSTESDNMRWKNIAYRRGSVVLSKSAFYQSTRNVVRGEAEPGTQASIGIWKQLNEDSGSVVFFGQGDYDTTHTTESHNWGMPVGTYPMLPSGETLQPGHKDIYYDTIKGSFTTFSVKSYPPTFSVSGTCKTGADAQIDESATAGMSSYFGELSEGPSVGHEDIMNFLVDGEAQQLDMNGYYWFDNTGVIDLKITRGFLVGNVIPAGKITLVIWSGDKDGQNHGWALRQEDAAATPGMHIWSLNTPNPTPVPDDITAHTHLNNYYGSALIGEIKMWPSGAVPAKHLVCDGSIFDPLVYPELALVLPSHTLPDMRGQFVRGAAAGKPIDFSKKRWTTGGPRNQFGGATVNNGNHSHTAYYDSPAYGGSFGGVGSGGYFGGTSKSTSTAGSHSHGFTITTGGDTETAPDHIVMNYIIRVTNV